MCYACDVEKGKWNPSGAQCCTSQLLVSPFSENRGISVSLSFTFNFPKPMDV